MPQFNAHLFSAVCVLQLPALLLFSRWRDVHLSTAFVAADGLLWAWTLANIVWPMYTSPLRNIPEPTEKAGFFTAHGTVMFRRPPGAPLLEWMNTTPNDGLLLARIFGHTNPRLIPTTPETVSEVLSTHAYDYHKPKSIRDVLARLLGNGLILVEDKAHKFQRKAVTPSFHGRHIRDLVPLFWSKSVHFVKVVASEMASEPQPDSQYRTGVIEISSIAQRITLDIICEAGLGRDSNTLENPKDELADQYATLTDPSSPAFALYFVLSVLFPQWFMRALPWSMNKVIDDASSKLKAICRHLIEDKKVARAEKSLEGKDILSVLMQSDTFPEEGLVDQLLTFLAAGHETTSSALTWASYLLSTHPEVQDKLRKEIQHAFQRTDLPETMDVSKLDSVPYLEAVCNETLRLYPTVPVTIRESIRQTTIGKQVVPKGIFVLIAPWAFNRMESCWGPDALEFKPERWMGEGRMATGGASSPFAFQTFIHGPRSCIGQGFARTELRCLSAAMVLKFQIEMANPSDPVIPEGAVTIKPRNGLSLRLKEIV